MKIDSARYEGGELILKTSSSEARKLMSTFTPGDYEIRLRPKKRSLDANAFAWALIHEIAEAAGVPPITVYQDAILNLGGTSDVIMVAENAVESFKKAFIGDHLGRQVDTMPNADDGWITCICHYGSSDFSVQQMSAFIDNLLQDAEALDIVTPERARIDSLLEAWDAKENKGSANSR